MSAAPCCRAASPAARSTVLADAELLELHADCASDADSLQVLEAYLDRRLGGGLAQQPSPAAVRVRAPI